MQAAYEAEMAACARDFDTIGAPLSGLSSAIAAFDSGDARHAYSLADAALAACKPFPSTVNGTSVCPVCEKLQCAHVHILLLVW